MSSLTRRGFLSAIAGTVVVGGLTACGGGGQSSGSGSSSTQAASLGSADDEVARSEIRNAIMLLFDRQYVVDSISQNGELPANTFVCQGVQEPNGSDFAFNSGKGNGQGYFDASQAALKDNFAKAIEVLKKYYTYDEGSQKFTNFPPLTYLYNTNENHKAIGEYLQSVLAQVGITMNLENQEWATFLNTRKSGGYSVARNGWIMDYTDPISMLDMWTTRSGNNDVQFGKGIHVDMKAYDLDLTPFGLQTKVEKGTWAETYDVLIDTINKTTDQNLRFQLMHVAEDFIMSTGCLCPIYYYTMPYMLSKDVTGHFSIPLGFQYFKGTTFKGSDAEISVCIASEPDTLDPALNSAVDGATMAVHLFAGLAKWVKTGDNKYEIAPDCVEELVEGVTNEDGTVTYTYKLRDGLKWSDGKDLTAGDFVFAWKRASSDALGADYGEMYSVVKGYDKGDLAVKAIDDKTLEVTTTNLIAYWNQLLAFPAFFPTREDVVSNESWATSPSTYVCNGAYKMAQWDHNSLIVLEKNDNYWDSANTTMKKINFYLSDDGNNILSNFETGAWQFIENMPNNEIARLKSQYPDEYVVAPYAGTYYVCWNVTENILPAK